MSTGVRLDAIGLRCPQPVILLARRARELPGGTVVEVLSTDVAAPGDIGAWCRMRGHTLVRTGPAPDHPDGVALTVVALARS